MIDTIIKLAPISAALLCVLALLIFNLCKKRSCQLDDLIIVFLAGASLPTAMLLIYSGFDKTVLSKLIDAGIYVALSGVSLLYVGFSSLRSKFK